MILAGKNILVAALGSLRALIMGSNQYHPEIVKLEIETEPFIFHARTER